MGWWHIWAAKNMYTDFYSQLKKNWNQPSCPSWIYNEMNGDDWTLKTECVCVCKYICGIYRYMWMLLSYKEKWD